MTRNHSLCTEMSWFLSDESMIQEWDWKDTMWILSALTNSIVNWRCSDKLSNSPQLWSQHWRCCGGVWSFSAGQWPIFILGNLARKVCRLNLVEIVDCFRARDNLRMRHVESSCWLLSNVGVDQISVWLSWISSRPPHDLGAGDAL